MGSVLDSIAKNGDAVAMRYPGGKGGSFRQIINLMPAHRVYIETHLGGGAVLRNKRPAEKSIGVELDADVVASWEGHIPEGATVVHDDAIRFLKAYRYTGDELVYCDPPYPKHVRRKTRIYRFDYTVADHEELLDVLRSLPCKVMVSSYDNSLYRDRLAEWQCATFSSASHVGAREECIWYNYDTPAVPWDTRFVGTDFREREQIKRRHERLIARISRMNSMERHLLFTSINEKFHDELRPK